MSAAEEKILLYDDCRRSCPLHGSVVQFRISKTKKNPNRGFHFCQECQNNPNGSSSSFRWQWCDGDSCEGIKYHKGKPCRSTSPPPPSLSVEHDEIIDLTKFEEDNNNCVICLDRKRTMICLPCAHITMCETCEFQFTEHHRNKTNNNKRKRNRQGFDKSCSLKCPLCNTRLEDIRKVYF